MPSTRSRGVMSALPPKADKEQTCRHVRFVPKADSCTAASPKRSILLVIVGLKLLLLLHGWQFARAGRGWRRGLVRILVR